MCRRRGYEPGRTAGETESRRLTARPNGTGNPATGHLRDLRSLRLVLSSTERRRRLKPRIDQARSDVRSLGLDWSVSDIPEVTARDAQQRVRHRPVQQGWNLTQDRDRAGAAFRELGFRLEHPDNGDQVDIKWNNSTTTLFVSVYAPCGKVPDDCNEHVWTEAEWHPKRPSPP